MHTRLAVTVVACFATPILGNRDVLRHLGSKGHCLMQTRSVVSKTVFGRHNVTRHLPMARLDNTTELVPPETVYRAEWCVAGALVFIALTTYAYGLLTMRPADEQSPTHNVRRVSGRRHTDVHMRSKDPLEEDIFHLAVSSLVRDAVFVANGEEHLALRISRLLVHLLLVMTTIIIQIVLVIQINLYVTPQAVYNIRNSYDQYEFVMYGSQENHTTLTVNGKHRGMPAYFQPDLFESLDDDLKTEVCNIPFSQPCFFMLVLFIWSLTCTGQIRQCLELVLTIVFVTPTISHMEDAIVVQDDGSPRNDVNFDGTQDQLIAGITPLMKAALMTLILAPWLGLTCFLLWLGCRWFAATDDWDALVTNAVALEFIILLKDLLYVTLVSERSKRELRNTYVRPLKKQEPVGYQVFFSGLVWGVIAIIWVVLYVYRLQQVLPDYRWDVRGSCTNWFAQLLAQPG